MLSNLIRFPVGAGGRLLMTPQLNVLLRGVSRPMYLSLAALPPDVREALGLGYLLCRTADVVAATKGLPPEKRSRYLGALRGVLQGLRDPLEASREIADALLPLQEHLTERRLLDQLAPCFKSWKSLPEPERDLVKLVVESVSDGLRMDLTRFKGELASLETKDELIQYCTLVGGGPGVFWTRICLLRLPALEHVPAVPLIRHGLKLGQALEATSLLRSAAQDLKAGRCYFPAEQLKAAGLAPLDLLAPASAPGFRPLVKEWALWALSGLDNGVEYMRALPPSEFRLRAAVSWPIELALKTLTLVAGSKDVLNPAKRIKVGTWGVYGLLLSTPLNVTTNERFELSYRRGRIALLKALRN